MSASLEFAPDLASNETEDSCRKFETEITGIKIQELSVLPDISEAYPAVEAGRRFISSQYSSDQTLYVDSQYVASVGDEIVGFESYSSNTGVASFHGVFFGELHVSSGATIPVAVKPHKSIDDDLVSRREAEQSCFADYFTNIATEQAHIGSLKSLGFVIGRDGGIYTLSIIEDELTTLDSIDWTVFFEEGEETQGMRDIWRKAAVNIANLHSIGASFHGDLATRNIATNTDGQILLIDWEFGNITERPSVDMEERFGRTLHDLRKLVEDLLKPTTLTNGQGVGLFTHCKGSYWEAFEEFFFDKYEEWREIHAAQGKHHTKKVEGTAEELTQLRTSLVAIFDQYQQHYQKNK